MQFHLYLCISWLPFPPFSMPDSPYSSIHPAKNQSYLHLLLITIYHPSLHILKHILKDSHHILRFDHSICNLHPLSISFYHSFNLPQFLLGTNLDPQHTAVRDLTAELTQTLILSPRSNISSKSCHLYFQLFHISPHFHPM
jgi:hypothetical protein